MLKNRAARRSSATASTSARSTSTRWSRRSEIKNGKLDVTKFETKSGDGELHVDFSMTLAPVLDDSMVTGCLRFKGSEALLKKEPKTFAAIQTTGAPLGPDGLFTSS